MNDDTTPPPARLHLIYARAANGVIGRNNTMPWHLPEDMAHFKRTTMGCPVIMGRKTWDSLPARFRPLPGRRNVVISRDPQWAAEGAVRAASLHEAVQACPGASDIWVMGGGQIYAQALPLAHSVVVTEIAQDFEGDTYAPELGDGWQAVLRDAHVSANGLAFAWVTYERGPLPPHDPAQGA